MRKIELKDNQITKEFVVDLFNNLKKGECVITNADIISKMQQFDLHNIIDPEKWEPCKPYGVLSINKHEVWFNPMMTSDENDIYIVSLKDVKKCLTTFPKFIKTNNIISSDYKTIGEMTMMIEDKFKIKMDTGNVTKEDIERFGLSEEQICSSILKATYDEIIWRNFKKLLLKQNFRNMTKKEIVSIVADNLGVTKKATDEVVTALFEAITNELKNGNEVAINGFGKFSVTERAAREGINPKTMEKVQIPAKKSVKFKAMGEIKSL